MHSSQRDFHRVVAIDGPAASGKSSVARELARRLGFVYVNSGAIYRAITWPLLEKGITAEDFDGVVQALESASITSCLLGGDSRILIDNVDPAEHLRDSRVNESVARVSRLPAVREIVAKKLHDNARSDDLVVEGRDIGSVVFPNPPYKFYVDASPGFFFFNLPAPAELYALPLRDPSASSRPVS